MDITLALVRLHHKQIGHMASDMIFVAGGITTKHFLETNGRVSESCHRCQKKDKKTYIRELANARSQFCRLIMEIISGVALPASLRRATCTAAKVP